MALAGGGVDAQKDLLRIWDLGEYNEKVQNGL